MSNGEFYYSEGADIKKWGGVEQTGADLTPYLLNLDIALSALQDAICAADPNTTNLNDLATRLDSLLAELSTRASEDTLSRAIPLAKADLFNMALPAAEANWFGSDIVPTNVPSYLRIYACVSVAGILRVVRTVGGVTVTEDLNSGNTLAAGASHLFDIPWRSGDSVNLRYSVTGGTIYRLVIDEFGAAV